MLFQACGTTKAMYPLQIFLLLPPWYSFTLLPWHLSKEMVSLHPYNGRDNRWCPAPTTYKHWQCNFHLVIRQGHLPGPHRNFQPGFPLCWGKGILLPCIALKSLAPTLWWPCGHLIQVPQGSCQLGLPHYQGRGVLLPLARMRHILTLWGPACHLMLEVFLIKTKAKADNQDPFGYQLLQ
jgi:hypothetical protein